MSAAPATDTTVVVTCFNYGEYLREAVESARAQARVLVVDDGSSDPATLEVLGDLPEDVELITQPNAGAAAARNTGLRRAQTPYLLCLDADDRLAPGAIGALRQALECNPEMGFAYGWMHFFGQWDFLWRTPPYDPYKLLYRHQIGLSSLIRRELFEATDGFDAAFGEFEDWELWVNALAHGFHGVRVPVVALDYRKHGRNKQHADRRRYQEMYAALRRKHAGLYARAGDLARETQASAVDRVLYPYFWGRRPLPAAVEHFLQSLALRSRR